MTVEVLRDTAEQQEEEEQEAQEARNNEAGVVRGGGVLSSMLRGLYWPFGLAVRAYRGLWWLLGFRHPQQKVLVSPAVCSPGRQNLSGRKRLRRVTRLLLSVLPQWVQGALGYPVSSSIGRAISPEIRVSPTKPCGKGSKRKQDELDEDDCEEEEERQTWVEALTQELADDDAPEEDPDYEPSTIETESDEYHSHNDTESDLELKEKGMVIIEDVSAGDPSTQADTSGPV